MAWPWRVMPCWRRVREAAFGDGDLCGDQDKAGQSLGHRVFDENAGVHFKEVEFGAGGVDKEFDGAEGAEMVLTGLGEGAF